jgi:hypothetical protein
MQHQSNLHPFAASSHNHLAGKPASIASGEELALMSSRALWKGREHFVPAFHLRVVGIPDLQPAMLGINAGFPFADHTRSRLSASKPLLVTAFSLIVRAQKNRAAGTSIQLCRTG